MSKRTALYQKHVDAGAKMVDFGGFEMPLKYTSESVEHLAVRNAVGVFDVSHMGEIFVEGKDALAQVRKLVTNDPAGIVDGQAMYAGLLNERGTFVDDVVVYRFNAERFLIVVNAGNRDKDWAFIKKHTPTARDEGERWSQLAIQGPKAVDVVAKLCGESVRDIKGYCFIVGACAGVKDAIVARTGYTGEDGFEIYVDNSGAVALWDAVLEAGRDFGIIPCGLAARDTLRLEAGMALYGNDIDEDHTPLEANLGWIVKGHGFTGESALAPPKRLLRGLKMIDRGIARHGYAVHDEAGANIGVVTSGTQTPFLNQAIAIAYLDKPHTEPGAFVFVDVRGKKLKAQIVKLPFYKRARPASEKAS